MRKTICIVTIILLLLGCFVAKSEEEFTYCKRRLYEFDEIEKGCDKYFKNESWYKTYINEVEKNYQNLK